MSKRLLFVNVLVLAVSGAAAAHIVRVMTEPSVRPIVRARPAAPATPPAPPAAPAAPASPGAFAVVASKNLFSPTRSDAPPAGATAQSKPAPPPVKPTLFGIILREGTPVAYLEDPATKRVAGYRLGDAIAGGTIQAIHADHVVLARPDGPMDVQLRDPSKPRPQPTTPVPAVQPRPQPVPGQVQAQPTPPAVSTPPGLVPPRRPLPPNLLRRLPPNPADAPQQ